MSWPQSQWPPGTQVPITITAPPPITRAPTGINSSSAQISSGTGIPPPSIQNMSYPTGVNMGITNYNSTQYANLNADQQYALQQNWQQWQTYHQQYAQWHAQYGEQYQREMQAKLGVVPPAAPPLPYVSPISPFVPSVMPFPYSTVPPPPQNQVTSEVKNAQSSFTSKPPPPPLPPSEDKNNKSNLIAEKNSQNKTNLWKSQQEFNFQQMWQPPPQYQNSANQAQQQDVSLSQQQNVNCQESRQSINDKKDNRDFRGIRNRNLRDDRNRDRNNRNWPDWRNESKNFKQINQNLREETDYPSQQEIDIFKNNESKSPEELKFDEQFKKWEEDFENWKKLNSNHPDKKLYKEYEMKFEECRRKLLARREQMRKRKLENNLKQSGDTGMNNELINMKNQEHGSIQNQPWPENEQNNSKEQLNNQIKENEASQQKELCNKIIEFSESKDEGKDKNCNDNVNDKLKVEEKLNNSENKVDNSTIVANNTTVASITEDANKSENVVGFLQTISPNKGGIPGLDLVSESLNNLNNEQTDNNEVDVIDLEMESNETDVKLNKSKTDSQNENSKNLSLNICNFNNENNSEYKQNEKSSQDILNSKEQWQNKEQVKDKVQQQYEQQQNQEKNQQQQKYQEQKHIPSLLDKIIEKPSFSPERNEQNQSFTFGQSLNENINSNTNIPNQNDLVQVLSNPNLLALLTAAINNAGGNMNNTLKTSNLDNSNTSGNIGGSSPWISGVGNTSGANIFTNNVNRTSGNSNQGRIWNNNNQRNFGFSRDNEFHREGEGKYEDRRLGLVDERRYNDSRSHTGTNFMNERNHNNQAKSGGLTNPFKDKNDLNQNKGRDCFAQKRSNNNNRGGIRNRNNRDRSRSSNRNDELPQQLNDQRIIRNPFKTEINDPIKNNLGQKEEINRREFDDYFRPTHVIDYQNKSFFGNNLNKKTDILVPTKVVDYGHKSTSSFSKNSLEIFGDNSNNSGFFPMKTIDYGHSSSNVKFENNEEVVKIKGDDQQNLNIKNNFEQLKNKQYKGQQIQLNQFQQSGKNRRNKNGRLKNFFANREQRGTTNNDGTNKQLPSTSVQQTLSNSNEKSKNLISDLQSQKEFKDNKIVDNDLDDISENENSFDETIFKNSPGLSEKYGNINKNNSVMSLDQQNNIKKPFSSNLNETNKTNDNDSKLTFPNYDNINNPLNNTLNECLYNKSFSIQGNNPSSSMPLFMKLESKSFLETPITHIKFSNQSLRKNIISIDDIILKPGRDSRSNKVVIILRGPPGSGKTYLAKLIKEKEIEMGGSAPRLLSIDDYFINEIDKEEKCVKTGKKVVKKEMVYEYDKSMEDIYMQYLLKSYKKTISDNLFNFIIVDCINSSLKTVSEFFNMAKEHGFIAYVVELLCDLDTCLSQNIHNRTEEDIKNILNNWCPTPECYVKLDVTSILECAAIQDVEMEDVSDNESGKMNSINDEAMENNQQTEIGVFKSKWDSDPSEDLLARLDGTHKPLQKNATMEDFLQLDNWEPSSSMSGKKRVRWADIEEKRAQEKLREIGFVVGHTDWNRMMDPSAGSKALTQTKLIERVKKN